MVSYDAAYSRMNPGIHIDGLNIFSKNVFGSEIPVIYETFFLNYVSIKGQIFYFQFAIQLHQRLCRITSIRIDVITDLDIG